MTTEQIRDESKYAGFRRDGQPSALIQLTTTHTFRARSADHLALLVDLGQRGPGESGELARRLGWDRSRVEGACRDAAGEVKKGDYGWHLTADGRRAVRGE